MLSRCIAIDPQTFADEHWGREPLLSRPMRYPATSVTCSRPQRSMSCSPSAGCAHRSFVCQGGRSPGRDCYLGPAGFGAEMPDQVDSAKVLDQFASGATIVLQGLHRLWPPLIDFVRSMVDDLGHPVQANAYITPPQQPRLRFPLRRP